MSIYQEISELKGPVEYVLNGHNSLGMKEHYHPWSIKQDEFFYLKKIIIQNNLKVGYEIATAFGISSLAIGLGFKETGGKLITMDAYIEEKYGNAGAYDGKTAEIHADSDGYKSVNFLIEHYGLQNIVFPEIGWSPDDTAAAILKHTNEKIDFVFIDGGHFPEQIIKDIESVLPFLNDKYIMTFHDTHTFNQEVNDFIYKVTGKLPTIVCPGPDCGPDGWNLSIVDNVN